jgi:hypothetical protein
LNQSQNQNQNEIETDVKTQNEIIVTNNNNNNNTTDISAINNILPDIIETQGVFLNSETLDNGVTNIQKID